MWQVFTLFYIICISGAESTFPALGNIIRRSFDEDSRYVVSIPKKEHTFCLIQRIIWQLKLKIVLFEKIETDSKTRKQFYNFFIQENFYQKRNELEEAVQNV